MTSRPSEYWIVGPKVLEQIKEQAPDHVREGLLALLLELRLDPYPGPDRSYVSEMKGTDRKHMYVAWCDDARVWYQVMQDQPVIALIGVHWYTPPSDPDEGEDGDGWDFTLAA